MFWQKLKPSFPVYRQLDSMDCGPTCVRMIASYHGRSFPADYLRQICHIGKIGVTLMTLSEASEKIGMRTFGARLPFEKLSGGAPLPCIAHWKGHHFVVVTKVTKKKVVVADPAAGMVTYSHREFKDHWSGGKDAGIVLLVEPRPEFFEQEDVRSEERGKLSFLWRYFRPYKRFISQIFLGLLVASILQLILPFLTQIIVDFGITNRDLNFVTLILIAQLMLFLSRTSVEFIRRWILLHLGTRINISIISDFLIKLMKLPIGFFDSKNIGDLMQRINDHNRIEAFLTSSTINSAFSMMNLIIFGLVLGFYNLQILTVFLVGSLLSAIWILVFLRKRRMLDHKRFDRMGENQASLFQIITGMRETKLFNAERETRWKWEHIQAGLFRVNVQSLSLTQLQSAGNLFLNELKNIIITFLAARAVISGEMTLGMMMSVTYIIGQLNTPIAQLLGLFQEAQDARLSLERLSEIHEQPEEDPDENKLDIFPSDTGIEIRNLDFHYAGPHSEKVLDNLNLTIEAQKVTAIVGMSGSGKSTLLKLLLKFYPPTRGEILVGGTSLKHFNTQLWRRRCGTVMQDGFIFSDTVARNITMGDNRTEANRFLAAIKAANIESVLQSLPQGYNTRIGGEGQDLSQGQKQRILMARAIYMDPEYLFFDEATSALDANNERKIMENLRHIFKGRTVLVVAHRLSTVKNANKIVVMDAGRIVETGRHHDLVKKKGAYFNLVKNQLELGD